MSKLTILLMTANSLTSPLALDEEERTIDEAMRKGNYRDAFDLRKAPAVRYGDLQSTLLRWRPYIVHFSGHGSEYGELMVVKDASGETAPVPIAAVGELFSILRENIRVVVLNACFSDKQARAIAKFVDCVVGTSRELVDSDAVDFAAGFYEALGYGESVDTAFRLGRNRIQLAGSERDKLTRLYVRTGVDATKVVLTTTGQGLTAATPPESTPTVNQPVTSQPSASQPVTSQPVTSQPPANSQPMALPNRLTGPQYKALQTALLNSFTHDELAEIVQFELGEALPNIVSSGDNKKVAFELIGWAQRTGKLPDLIRGALNAEPKRAEIEAFVGSLG